MYEVNKQHAVFEYMYAIVCFCIMIWRTMFNCVLTSSCVCECECVRVLMNRAETVLECKARAAEYYLMQARGLTEASVKAKILRKRPFASGTLSPQLVSIKIALSTNVCTQVKFNLPLLFSL